jgi:WhiB family redox-sensing transcriptional regulator
MWRTDALCQENPELFFDRSTVKEAKKICKICPVQRQCLESAISFMEISGEQQHGVIAGLSERERAVLFNKPRRTNRRRVT